MQHKNISYVIIKQENALASFFFLGY